MCVLCCVRALQQIANSSFKMRFLQPLLLAATAASLGFEPLPQWPLEFSANFTSPSSAKNTSGFWASSSEHRSEVLRFHDGTRDHLCSAYHNGTACTVLATGGWLQSRCALR